MPVDQFDKEAAGTPENGAEQHRPLSYALVLVHPAHYTVFAFHVATTDKPFLNKSTIRLTTTPWWG
jgi:hypothetical protein